MQFRDHEAVQGKRDFYPVDPRKLKIDPNYNVRDLTTPDELADLQELKESIKANGVRVPLEVRLDGEDIYVVAGHRRHAATMMAIKEGAKIATVPCVPEPKGTNEIERTINLVVSNSGKPLSPLQTATVCKRLIDFGFDVPQIASRLGKSPSTVENYLSLNEAPHAVQQMVRSGEVSASTAAKVVRKEGATQATATLTKAKTVAAAAGKTTVTESDVKEAKGEFNPTKANVDKLIASVRYTAAYSADKKCKDKASDCLSKLGLTVFADGR